MKKATTSSQALRTIHDIGQYDPFDLDNTAVAKAPAARRAGHRQRLDLSDCITHVATSQGPKPILRTMVTTACERNCNYCAFRAGRSATQRLAATPDALAGAFMEIAGKGLVQGFMLSSGIINGGQATQDQIIATADILRKKHRYKGYIHLKIMPGADEEQIRESLRLADRVSTNLEGPTPARLLDLAPKKDLTRELLPALQQAHTLLDRHRDIRSSIATQFVVGAVDDTDVELLGMTENLYRQWHLARVYYSAFNPVTETPFEGRPAESGLRQHRLYQASYLLRDYRWQFEDLPFNADGRLPLDTDPKQLWAQRNLAHAPVEIMTADYAQLLRVPGIGPKGARRILSARRHRRIRDLETLRQIGAGNAQRIAPYVLLDGKRPWRQPRLL
jgi:predicted DNA-binding helix-hairpin-helix protein